MYLVYTRIPGDMLAVTVGDSGLNYCASVVRVGSVGL